MENVTNVKSKSIVAYFVQKVRGIKRLMDQKKYITFISFYFV